jgi:hypothetical protein
MKNLLSYTALVAVGGCIRLIYSKKLITLYDSAGRVIKKMFPRDHKEHC